MTPAQVFSYEFCEILRTPFYRTPLVAASENYKSSFQKLLIIDNSLNTHHRNLQKFVLRSSKIKLANHLSTRMNFSSLSKDHTHLKQIRVSD